jgi:hypothetical protein
VKLLAISDLHIGYRANREGLEKLGAYPDDWLLVAGDVGEHEQHLRVALSHLVPRFARVIWTPGNHELWTTPGEPGLGRAELAGEAKYQALVSICRQLGVTTPEDPYPLWEGSGGPRRLAPLFVGYDYSFRPDSVPVDQAVLWARESGILCSDELRLSATPFESMPAWCASRVAYTESRLRDAGPDVPLVLMNHFPLVARHAAFRLMPRFAIWCGTRRTAAWHRKFPVDVVVYGHVHRRGTYRADGVRFENVALGYPKDWQPAEGMDRYLRQILPAPRVDWQEPGSWCPPPPPAILVED